MVRVTKLADYGILLLTWFAQQPEEDGRHSASSLAQETGLPQPTVSKLLQALCKAGILDSQRGVSGGYRLAHRPEHISVAQIIQALEGPIGLTECITHGVASCDVGASCSTRTNWDRINTVLLAALSSITLAEMARPQRGWRQRVGASLVATSEPAASTASRRPARTSATVPLLPLAPKAEA